MNNYYGGKWAEFAARMYMRLHGWNIVAKNHKSGRGTGIGEIDFVAAKANCIAFVEVKKRQSLDNAAYSISKEQQKRLINGAKMFLKTHPQYEKFDVRFDAILIAPPFKLKHLPNAWMCQS